MPKVPVVPSLKIRDIEKKANEVSYGYSASWNGLEPVPVDLIFDYDIKHLGVRTLYTNLLAQGISAYGYTDGINKISMIDEAVANNYTVAGRRFFRSTAGHESGHCFLHVPYGAIHASLQSQGYNFKRDRSNLKPWEDPEWQAWRFCKALCMPEHLVRALVRKYDTKKSGILVMVEAFDMSFSFVQGRLRDLKLLPR